MTLRKHRPLVAVLLLSGFLSVALWADSRPGPDGDWPSSSQDKRVEKSFAVDGRLVSVESNSADIVVEAVAGGQARLVVELEYWSSNEEWMEAVERDFDVEIRETPSEISLHVGDMPDAGRKGWFKRIFGSSETFYSVEITLQVPPGTDLGIDNRYGDVEIVDIGGALDLVNTSGDIVASGIRGGGDIENSYGDATVTDVEGGLTLIVTSGKAEVAEVAGDTKVSNRYGEVVISGVTGKLDLETSSSEIEVQSVTGPAVIVGSYADAEVTDLGSALKIEISSGNVDLSQIKGRVEVAASYGAVRIDGVGEGLVVRSSSGEIEARDIGGAAKVENSYGTVLLEEIRGSVEINNPSGGVTVVDVQGDVWIRSSYEAVRVREVSGNLNVSATSSGVRAEDIGGGAEVTTSYAGVELIGVGGPVDIRNQSGRVEVRGLSGSALAGQSRVETSYGDVDFSWPGGAGAMSFTLESTYGSIHSDFAAVSRKRGSRETAEGQAGGGREDSVATVTISARSGSIFLRED